MVLPAELIDHIFSFLRGDISSLKACLKALPMYSRLAERHIYAEITVNTLDPSAVYELYEELSKNAHSILDYPRTLTFRTIGIEFPPLDPILSILSIIPRMINLISLTLLGDLCRSRHYEHFLPTFRACLQESSIEELALSVSYHFPLSALDNGRNIRKLTLSNLMGMMDDPISTSSLLHQPLALETLIIAGSTCEIPNILLWTMRRVSHLTSLELHNVLNWTVFPELLTACSNSLTRLYLDVGNHCQSKSSYPNCDIWLDDNQKFPFTLSALMFLKKLTIVAKVSESHSEETGESTIRCALPAITRLINTALSIQTLTLCFHCQVSDISSLGQLDWSPLDGLQSLVALRIKGEETGSLPLHVPLQSILDSLARSETLVGLVERGIEVGVCT